MGRIIKEQVAPGIIWVEIPEADLRVLCGSPADSVKHLMRRGLIRPVEVRGVRCETGPNAVLLSDVMLQNGAFCNLTEFPILQMFYRQGMLVPDHPNNTGAKPLLIGRRDQVEAQIAYIHRGNYGLISEQEMVAAGASPERAHALMRIKLHFAFGRICNPRELVHGLVLEDGAVEIAPGATLRRIGLNRFEFAYGDETVAVDLNLAATEVPEAPYSLGAFQFRREYFAVVHSGEGDGWDIRRPSMGAVVVYQGRIYLVDAGPNIGDTLTALGIGINEVEGIFHTHSHDDHFAGLPTLMQADHRIKYFAEPLVRAAVTKKLCALLPIAEDDFEDYFHVHDLVLDEWNDIAGLEVRPIFSPHPVENTIFQFRALTGDGWRSYAHYADMTGFRILDQMVTEDDGALGLSPAVCAAVKADYLAPADVKKVDIGGGLIHGEADDFRDDASRKIILAHTASRLSPEQRRIGSGASFGTVEVLIPSHRDFTARTAQHAMHAYFPRVSAGHLGTLLNGPILVFNPETILLKAGQVHDSIYLLLTGQVEVLDEHSEVRATLSAGALLGELTGLHGLPPSETYRALSFVQVLEIRCGLYTEFVRRHDLFAEISRLMEGREFLSRTRLFGSVVSTAALNAIAKNMRLAVFAAGQAIDRHERCVGLIKSGSVARMLGEQVVETLGPGDVFGEEAAVFDAPATAALAAREPTEIYLITASLLGNIPNVRWKLFETFERRTRLEDGASGAERILMAWHEAYSVNVQQFDAQHRRLFATANSLLDAVNTGRSRDEVATALEFLLHYTMYHFAEEEGLLERYGFPETFHHQSSHRKLIAQVEDFGHRFSDDTLSAQELLEFLHSWIIDHILIEDRKYGEYLNEKGVY
ncbi:MAG: bacteriohemerythrin [Magnetospirillum sp.]|nr:bacteriohemerythrin [Magnetospirillum sp.]